MAFGLNDTGFTPMTLADLKAAIETDLKLAFGENINLNPQAVFGQETGIAAGNLSLAWEALEAIYLSQYPNTAQGVSLSNVVGINGIQRKPATNAIVAQQMFIKSTVGSVIIPIGTIVKNDTNTALRYQTTAVATTQATTQNEKRTLEFNPTANGGFYTIKFGTGIATTIFYSSTDLALQAALESLPLIGVGNVLVTGDYVNGFTIEFIGTFAGAYVPEVLLVTNTSLSSTTTARVIPTVKVKQYGGAPSNLVEAVAINPGSQAAVIAGQLNTLDQNIANVITINLDNSTPGTLIESDSELKARRNFSASTYGSSTPPAIQSKLSNIVNVTQAFVFENVSDDPDGQGRPGHSFEACISAYGGTNISVSGTNTTEIQALRQNVGDVLFQNKSAGIQTWGPISQVVYDSQVPPQAYTMNFSQPEAVPIWLTANIQITDAFGLTATEISNSTTTLLTNIIAFGNKLGVGKNVVVFPDLMTVFASVPGIVDVKLTIGNSSFPTLGYNILIGNGYPNADYPLGSPIQISTWLSSRIVITTTTDPIP